MTLHIPPGNLHFNQQELHLYAENFRRELLQACPEPFSPENITAGMENELQVAVEGDGRHVDLPLSLAESSFYRNTLLRAARGELPLQSVGELRSFIEEEEREVWENSWVRFPRSRLGAYAQSVLSHDLLADKNHPEKGKRNDTGCFLLRRNNEQWLRLPISYLLKLSLAEAVSRPEHDYPFIRTVGRKVMRHFISDNISPEITSFHLASGSAKRYAGQELAGEASRRFFFIQLLIGYAESRFDLAEHGQSVHIYSAPTPPVRQKKLNRLISDKLYCDLFLNPCLSGWPRGEEKKAYMGLCHRTLCSSRLNTITKIKDAGILNNNLIVLPNTSGTSLANNGTHITIGSKTLSRCFADSRQGDGTAVEKYFGDLVIKIVEHFLPLFVTSYTAAPYRLPFGDFHPEKVLGFLPHELESTHLRMIWRRWKKKAHLRFCGHDFTPMGPEKLDRVIGKSLGLKGDYIPDFRLINYLIALQSLDTVPALNGTLNNQDVLKHTLFEMGVFDTRMSMYLPYRMRDIASYGFSGFEGRHYSLFPDFHRSMAGAADLQSMITALAYTWVIQGKVKHHHIPDSPFIESERRQIFFSKAIGIPTFYVRSDTTNEFLRQILAGVERQRLSRRYKGYIRIEIQAYLKAALNYLRSHAGILGETPGFQTELDALEAVIDNSRPSADTLLTEGILNSRERKGDALSMDADEFNRGAEHYFRNTLLIRHMQEGLQTLIRDGELLEKETDLGIGKMKTMIIGSIRADRYIAEAGRNFINGKADPQEIHHLLLLCLLVIELKTKDS